MSAARIGYLSCCGIKEAIGIDGDYTTPSFRPASFVNSVISQKGRSPFVIFSSVSIHGEKLAKYIKRNKLGDIATLPSRINGNSGNRLKAWLWHPVQRRVTRKTKTT